MFTTARIARRAGGGKIGTVAAAAVTAINPQPLPPGSVRVINPQPRPPGRAA
jgi:hypothetical protein